MGSCLRTVCTVSIIYGLMSLLIKSRGIKRAADIACAAALTLTVISSVKSIDLSEYSKQLAMYRDYQTMLTKETADISDRLNRRVIETELSSYIMDEAKARGVDIQSISFTMEWSDGCWYPVGCEIYAPPGSEALMSGFIESELGIGRKDQKWKS